jgi:glycosyltransferase involved in cell wall biosynthesis
MQLGNPTGLYGAERWILALVRNLDPAIIRSSVTAIRDEPSAGAPVCEEAGKMGLDAYRIDAFGRVNAAAVSRLRRLLVEQKVSILHTHGYKTDVIGLLATLGTGCKVVATPHGWSTQAGWKLQVYEGLDRAVFPFFDAVVPLSSKLHSELKVLPGVGRKLHLINNAVDLSEVSGSAGISSALQTWKQQGDFIVGYIGQLISRKGLDSLIEAFGRWEFPRKRLVLVGDGPQAGKLKELASVSSYADRIHFAGFREDRLDWLRGFDIFVLASRLEGIPRCLMESLAARIPVIATEIPGCRDLITHEDTGLLVPVDDPMALAAAMNRLTDRDLRSHLSGRGAAHVEQYYSAARMGREYQDLFRELAA